ncbi:hypothetical protein ABMA27_002337 [Loxostege sticticalis]|uniref:RHD domain-containing protein n=1 Tax=Loxostege sticticalis TaxID=481309 RepID=A0ABR3HXE0_LOXSC
MLHFPTLRKAKPSQAPGVAPDSVVVRNVGDQSAHLSDVFEVISQTDPAFGAGGELAQGMMAQAPAPYAYIIEQPAPKSLRFRYECEGRSAGSIPGVNSVQENKTYPSIKICGYKGCMIIVVSCVTKEEPYKPHPHNLVGRDCQMGVCTVKVRTEGDADSCQVQFKNLGIQCVKRRDIAEALRQRQQLRVNPFKTSSASRTQPQSIDLNAVRLCFQVFLTDDAYKVQRALPPIVSEVIYDKKAMSDLLIVRSSHCSGPVKGGTTVILLCEKVTREDTEVWFFQEENGALLWSERGHIDYVHKQLAIVLKTPPYRDLGVPHHVTVQFQLKRLSDGAQSNPYSFEYIPEAQDKEVILGNKRRKKLSYNLQEYDDSSMEFAIKAEPHDRTPPHPMAAAGYSEQAQWRPDLTAAGSSHMQHGYAQLPTSWQSPPYGQSPSPHHAPQASPHLQPQVGPPAQQAGLLSHMQHATRSCRRAGRARPTASRPRRTTRRRPRRICSRRWVHRPSRRVYCLTCSTLRAAADELAEPALRPVALAAPRAAGLAASAAAGGSTGPAGGSTVSHAARYAQLPTSWQSPPYGQSPSPHHAPQASPHLQPQVGPPAQQAGLLSHMQHATRSCRRAGRARPTASRPRRTTRRRPRRICSRSRWYPPGCTPRPPTTCTCSPRIRCSISSSKACKCPCRCRPRTAPARPPSRRRCCTTCPAACPACSPCPAWACRAPWTP